MPSKRLAKDCSHEKLYWKARPYLFVPKKQRKYGKNWHFKKDSIEKLVKKVSYTEVVYNTVETPLSRKKSNLRASSYNHRAKDLPKTPLNFAFKKRPYPNILKTVAYKNAGRKTLKILILEQERTELFIRNVSQEFLSHPLLKIRSRVKILWKCSSILYRSTALPKTAPKLLYQGSTILNFSSKCTVQKCHPKHCQKFAAGKDCIEMLVMTFLYKKLPETPSQIHIQQKTVCKVSWKNCQPKMLPQTQSKNQTGEKVVFTCSSRKGCT